jgi:hypothetical protein
MSKTINILKRYKFFLLLAGLNIGLIIFYPQIGMQSVQLTWTNLLDMLSVLPPIFILLGLLDVWVKRDTMVKFMGENSGLIGVLMAF